MNTFCLAKKSWLRCVFALALIHAVCHCAGQTLRDTLNEVYLSDKRNATRDERLNNFSSGQKLVTIDSITLLQYKMQSVANLLAQQSPIFIKSYGLNGLATLNIRGSSAAQSQVLWNGIPINNAALGMADISMLPVAMIHKLHLVYGSSASLWGSGNVGGALLLESDVPSFSGKPKYELAVSTGSFGQYQAGGKLTWTRKKFFFSSDVFAQTAQNNFRYEDEWGQNPSTEHARLNGLALQQQIAYRHSNKTLLRFIGWYQNYYREIPAALFESYSEKIRKDESVRLMVDGSHKTQSGSLYGKLALLADKMRFDDDTIRLHARNISYQSFAEVGWKRNLSARHQLYLFAPLQLSWMKPDTLLRTQQKYALVLAYSYSDLRRRFKTSMSLRGEVINGLSVLLPGVGASYDLTPSLVLRANFQRTFRVPTLNELYYAPGGNENLRPEQGWSSDAGYRAETKSGKVAFHHDLSVYNRVIDDWIVWLGGAIWTPHNMATVHSRGLETENFLSVTARKWKFHLGLNASYVAATTISSHIPNDGSIGKQIPYTPEYSAQLNAGFHVRSLYFNYNHTYTGLRYVNVDETNAIEGYQTANVQMSYALTLQKKLLSFSAQVNNVFGSRYEVVNGRPMPGVNWLIGLRLSSRY